jgi:hypothetical protein
MSHVGTGRLSNDLQMGKRPMYGKVLRSVGRRLCRKIPLQLPSGEFEVSVVGERPVRTIFTDDHAVMLILASGDDRPHSNANP